MKDNLPKRELPSPSRPPNAGPDDRPHDASRAVMLLWLAFFVLAAVPLLVWFAYERRSSKSISNGTPNQQAAMDAARSKIPAARFTDITAASGISFTHVNGAAGERLLPETMGGGVAFLDFDNDGDQDLLFVNSGHWPWTAAAATASRTLTLYRNDGIGRFEDVTPGSGLDAAIYGMGVAVGDFDNDGLVDLFVTGVGANKLYRNAGEGRFSDITESANVNVNGAWSTTACWFDMDRDGDLDLFVGNYVKWSREIDLEVNYQLPGVGRAYGPPMNFPGTFPFLYRNDGNGKFTEVGASSGVHVKKPGTGEPFAKSLGVAPVDFDNDGWMDLIVANDTVQNFAFRNRGNGTFEEVGARRGLAFDPFGGVRGAMGIDASPIDEDNNLAVAIGNFANEMTALYVAQANSVLFADEAINQGIGNASRASLTFGVFFFDYDLDGWLDLLTANGHIEEAMERIRPGQAYRQSAQLYWNARGLRQDAGFVLVSREKCGGDILKPIVGRGSAYADIDNDGDLDVVMTQINGPAILLRNDQKLGHHWVRLKLVGGRSNRDAIGAWVKARVGNRTVSRQVMPTRGYLSQSELPVTIGIGNATRVDDLVVIWPDGSSQTVSDARVDATTVVEQKR